MAAWYKYHGLWVKLGFVGPGQLVQLGPLVNAGLLSNPLAFSWPPHTASELENPQTSTCGRVSTRSIACWGVIYALVHGYLNTGWM
ncbi:uncharacterized protein YALI1_B25495g [Yarrowia lipolytica]|uniref:Uncharacterized protein n=1 Tax=Yarrowia lipolytica TaxID=4952 RepID=A0A1D8N8H9_YARLL|nr:hypothetical protein YALI1_B25495g [Yarrowia lipolytica]